MGQQTGVVVSGLKPGTKVTVETANSFYELTPAGGRLVDLFGGTRADGGTRLPEPARALFVGSGRGDEFRDDWIAPGMRMGFLLEDGLLRTSPVRRVVIEAGNWSYSIG